VTVETAHENVESEGREYQIDGETDPAMIIFCPDGG
jgi:hypothetical protein